MNGTANLRMDDWAQQVSAVRISYQESEPNEDAALNALTRRYRERGFVRAAQSHLQDMDAMEQEARAAAPAHYRWDELCTNGRGDRFRHATYLGRQVMDVDDFATYFSQCREARRSCESHSVQQEQISYVPARTREQSRIAQMNGTSCVAGRQKQSQDRAEQLLRVAKEWLVPDSPRMRRVGGLQRVPVSMISLLVVVCVSLMLIVSSSVMVANAKRDVSRVGDEVAVLQREAAFAQDKLESSVDYLEIYRTATQEYGMIPASYVESVYLDNQQQNRIETVAQPDGGVALTTLLSAIGINIGS